jgi:glutaredoxin
MRDVIAALVLVSLGALGGCKSSRADGDARTVTVSPENTPQEARPAVPFEVRADGRDVLFFWFDERGASHTTSSIESIPTERRELVRVDPTRPELRVPGWIYVADLRAATPQGTFATRSVRADELSQQVMAMRGVQGPLGSQPPAPPAQPADPSQPGAVAQQGAHAQPNSPGVIIYGASWCHACHDAANWLRGHNVAFVEKDIEQDASAQAEMQDKARRAGVPTGSIPILDVRGHIMVGFSPPQIERALAGG